MPISAKRAATWAPQETQELAQGDKCFRMRFTGEVYADYDSYADAWLSYVARDWSCGLSGKRNLTFEEAAISEKTLKAQADLFPSSHVELLCRMVHMSTVKLEELCDDILRQMELRPIVGESVEAPPPPTSVSGKPEPAIVTRLFIAKDSGDNEDSEDMVEVGGPDDMLTGDELAVTHVEIEYEGGGGTVWPVAKLKRCAHDGSRRSCTKTMIRAKVRDVSTKDGFQGAPHVLNADMCAKYALNPNLPPHIMRLKEAWIRKQRGEKLAQEKERAEAALPEPEKNKKEEKTREIRDVACDDPAVVAAVRRIKIQFQPLFTPENLDLILPYNIRCAFRRRHNGHGNSQARILQTRLSYFISGAIEPKSCSVFIQLTCCTGW